MNVFVLSTGRCGSTTFARACNHIKNYSAAHESRIGCLGAHRVAYPADHIEADNRLSWHLGRLQTTYGNDAFYVHLTRDSQAVARSFQKRTHWAGNIMPAYAHGILMSPDLDPSSFEVCLDYCETINENIRAFIADKTHRMTFRLETAATDLDRFWAAIGAVGDLDRARAEWHTDHNSSARRPPMRPTAREPLAKRVKRRYWQLRKR